MTYATIDALRESLSRPDSVTPKAQPKGEPAAPTPAYAAKMLHEVPKSTVVDRLVFVLQQVAGKRAVYLGAAGPLYDGILKASKECVRVELALAADDGFGPILQPLPTKTTKKRGAKREQLPEVVVCSEVLQRLSNPGLFLKRLKAQYPGIPVVFTVPNAFAAAAASRMADGVENVNIEHVCWYSYRTLRTLLERHGFVPGESWHWCGGAPYTAAGLIVVARD